jgi:nicotinamidase-related amidase
MSHPNILDSSYAMLVVIDVQDSLLKAIHQADRVIANTVKLIEAAKVFDIPVLVTVQYPEKLGGCTELVATALKDVQVFPKTAFSCLGCKEFAQHIAATGRRQVILCGIEAHVCVNQTAHDLLLRGLRVHVARDAVSSRTAENYEVGIGKMRDSGCVITSTETAIFEMTGDASRAEFKRILPIVK